jgi:hypothetical protein
MSRMSIIETLTRLKSGETIQEINPSNEFWRGAKLPLDPSARLPYRFTLRDPPAYGKGAPAGIFERIYAAMVSRTFSEEQAALAIGKFSHTCTEREWTLWYRRLLEGKEIISREVFQEHAPLEFRFPALRIYDPPVVKSPSDLPQKFFIEPVYEGPRVLFFVSKESVKGFYYDGSSFEMEAHEDDFTILRDHPSTRAGVVLDMIQEDEQTLILRDVLTIEQFNTGGKTQDYEKRRSLMESFFYKVLEENTESFELGESYLASGYNDALIQINLLIEQGFEQFHLRDAYGAYWSHGDKKIEFTAEEKILSLVALTSGPKNSRYEDVVWSIEGTVPKSKKRIHHEIVLGLNSSQRKEIWNDQPAYAGRKFHVSWCGLDDDKLMFARFIKWKE